MTRSRLLVAAFAAAIAAVLAPLASPSRADASCILMLQFRGADYLGSSNALDPGHLVGPALAAAIPGCNDVISDPPLPAEPSTPVSVRRIRGVAPQLAVAYRMPDARSYVFAPDGTGCSQTTTPAALACLRRATRRLDAGPSVIAPVAAHPGDLIRLTVRVRDATLRRGTVSGIAAVLQGRGPDGRWRSLWHLIRPTPGDAEPPPPVAFGPPFAHVDPAYLAGIGHPVRLPDIAPGRYRLADRVWVRGRPRWVAAPLTIAAP